MSRSANFRDLESLTRNNKFQSQENSKDKRRIQAYKDILFTVGKPDAYLKWQNQADNHEETYQNTLNKLTAPNLESDNSKMIGVLAKMRPNLSKHYSTSEFDNTTIVGDLNDGMGIYHNNHDQACLIQDIENKHIQREIILDASGDVAECRLYDHDKQYHIRQIIENNEIVALLTYQTKIKIVRPDQESASGKLSKTFRQDRLNQHEYYDLRTRSMSQLLVLQKIETNPEGNKILDTARDKKTFSFQDLHCKPLSRNFHVTGKTEVSSNGSN